MGYTDLAATSEAVSCMQKRERKRRYNASAQRRSSV
jgi:hypothetical protein